MPKENLDSVVASGINLRKAIAMGMAGSDGSGGDTGSYDRSPAPKGEANPTVKEDLGMAEMKPGMGSMKSDKY